MLFTDINNIKENHIVCVQDNVENSGAFLIREFISSNLSNNTEIHVFCFDSYFEDLKNELKVNSEHIIYHDCLPTLLHTKESNDEFENFLSFKLLSCTAGKIIVVINSISTMLLDKDFKAVYGFLHKLISNPKNSSKKVVQVFIILHEDVLIDPAYVMKHLRYLCKVWLLVKTNTVSTFIKKSSGKLISQIYEYEINNNGKVLFKKRKLTINKCVNEESKQLPTSTFKLTLSDNEKKARDAVQLPYIKDHSQEISTGTSQIFYEPDEYDDWDEEDPDNDLEFT